MTNEYSPRGGSRRDGPILPFQFSDGHVAMGDEPFPCIHCGMPTTDRVAEAPMHQGQCPEGKWGEPSSCLDCGGYIVTPFLRCMKCARARQDDVEERVL